MNNEDIRYGFVGIITAHAAGQGPAIQRILADHADLILGRMGLPHLEDGKLGVITLIVRGSPAGLAALTGQLGRLKGVSVKSGMAAGLENIDSPPASVPERENAAVSSGTGSAIIAGQDSTRVRTGSASPARSRDKKAGPGE